MKHPWSGPNPYPGPEEEGIAILFAIIVSILMCLVFSALGVF